jgi:eukaryotic-like serine/threonine-protein kinase
VADQLEPIKRRVALKLIKPGMDSRSVLGRFEAERQALAVMDHPNIAKVLDAGTTTDGRPFFVMELVKGTPITEFCDARKLTPNQRLELFVTVCHAIQHAHMKGIIHRDIKPSNVLVALHDETPVAKVIDFGVAKAVGQQLTDKTIYTGFGALVGTPAYMAPEQATFNQLDVDTRADVYALGVLLYELLAGSPPIEKERLKLAALDEVLRIVRDEEPPRPSARLSTSQAKANIAAVRGSEPAKLSALMKGEIDWIVMKALEKDRTRRYESANGFAADVQRYLSGEQVQAVPPSMGYRLRKAYRRNRVTVQVMSAFALIDDSCCVSQHVVDVQSPASRSCGRGKCKAASSAS